MQISGSAWLTTRKRTARLDSGERGHTAGNGHRFLPASRVAAGAIHGLAGKDGAFSIASLAAIIGSGVFGLLVAGFGANAHAAARAAHG